MINTISNILETSATISIYAAVTGTVAIILLILLNLALKKDKLTKLARSLIKLFLVISFISIGTNIYCAIFDTNSIDLSKDKTRVFNTAYPGMVLMKTDKNIGSKDYSIKLDKKINMVSIYLWDFAAEDEDSVQVLVDDNAVTDPLTLKNSAIEVRFPIGSSIQIKGIKDGDGKGITYAAYFPDTGDTYFNCASKGSISTYRITQK